MARLPRIVVPGIPHHVTQRGNRRQEVFLQEDDYALHLFQGRFGCVAMDEAHLVAAFRYIALNPVKAKLVDAAVDWPWSSMPACLARRDDVLVLSNLFGSNLFWTVPMTSARSWQRRLIQHWNRPCLPASRLAGP